MIRVSLDASLTAIDSVASLSKKAPFWIPSCFAILDATVSWFM